MELLLEYIYKAMAQLLKKTLKTTFIPLVYVCFDSVYTFLVLQKLVVENITFKLCVMLKSTKCAKASQFSVFRSGGTVDGQ